MKRKLINGFILALTIILMTITSFTVGKYITLKEQKNTVPIVQQSTKDETKLISKEILVKKLNDENKMLVLSGETTVEVTYSNKNISDDDVNMKWIKDFFAEMKSKDLKVKATYTYQFHYDLKDLPIEVVGDEVEIYLSKNRISCQVELIENKSIYNDRVGVFEDKFTPQEINSLNSRTKDLVLNEIQAKAELRNKAIENVKANIEGLLNMKCNFTTSENDVVENKDKNIIKIN